MLCTMVCGGGGFSESQPYVMWWPLSGLLQTKLELQWHGFVSIYAIVL